MTRRSGVWALLAWAALTLYASAVVRALGARAGGLALMPQPAFAFLALAALRVSLPATLGLALVIGSEAAHAASAAPGLVEASYVWAAALVCWGRARWLGRGAKDVALSASALSLGVHVGIAALLLASGQPLGFSSVPAALLVPGALLDGLVALLAFAPLDALWQRLTPSPSARAIAFGGRSP